MKMTIAILCLLPVAGMVWADPYNIAIQQAKRVNDANNAEQNRLSQAEGGSSAGTGNAQPGQPAANPMLQATLQNISSLQTDIKAINASADASAASDQKIALLNDLSTAAQGAKASAASVKILVKDLMTALVGSKVTAAQQTKLARYLHATFNSSHLSTTQLQAMYDDVQKILTGAGVSVDAATDVVTDLKTVAGETK
jgi:hypothetical protein